MTLVMVVIGLQILAIDVMIALVMVTVQRPIEEFRDRDIN